MDKPFKSIGEQIAILESRGLECDNNTRLVLEREGYDELTLPVGRARLRRAGSIGSFHSGASR